MVSYNIIIIVSIFGCLDFIFKVTGCQICECVLFFKLACVQIKKYFTQAVQIQIYMVFLKIVLTVPTFGELDLVFKIMRGGNV